MDRTIFISHRHDDMDIASTLRIHLESWGITSNEIYQSSDSEHGSTIGETIKEDIKNFMSKAKLVILIYTFAQENWDYCMWECGLAMDPISASTRVIVFQCAQDVPTVFRDELRVTMNESDIVRFTKQFHCNKNFFPGMNPYKPNVGKETIHKRALGLFKALSKAIPASRYEWKIRWGFFRLRIQAKVVSKLNEINKQQEVFDLCNKISDTFLVTFAEGWGIRHFGFEQLQPELNFKMLVDRWKSELQGIEKNDRKKYLSEEWITDLFIEIWRVARNCPPILSWNSLKSVYPQVDWWVCPILNATKRLPDGGMELDIYMYRVDHQ